MKEPVIIIGGGPAGIMTAHCLKEFGVKSVVLEKGKLGQSWREMRSGMVMLSPADASHDMTSLSFENPIWKAVPLNGPFATREEFIRYMEVFSKDSRIKLREKCTVKKICKEDDRFEVVTADGNKLEAKQGCCCRYRCDRPSLPA